MHALRSLLICLCTLAQGILLANGPDPWPEIDPELLQRTTSTLEPEAGAEILYREETNRNYANPSPQYQLVLQTQYFSEAAVDEAKITRLFFGNLRSIYNIRCRTRLPDGSVRVMDDSSINYQDIIRVNDVSMKCVSFSPVALRPGAVVELAYDGAYHGVPYYFELSHQFRYPTRLTRQRVKMITFHHAVGGINFNLPDTVSYQAEGDLKVLEFRNVPSSLDEPYCGPSLQRRMGSIVYTYDRGEDKLSDAEILPRHAELTYANWMKRSKPTRGVRKFLKQIVEPTDTPEQKLQKIYDHCRSRIKNPSRDLELSTAERKKLLTEEYDPAQTLKTGVGFYSDVQCAYISLLRAAEIEVAPALVNDRSTLLYIPNAPLIASMPHSRIAAKIKGQWILGDPGMRYLPLGMLPWWNCDTTMMITQEQGPQAEPSPSNPAAQSVARKQAVLHLEADGAAHAELTLQGTGHVDADLKFDLEELDAARTDSYLRAYVGGNKAGWAIKQITGEHLLDALQPAVVKARIEMPTYADVADGDLLVMPNLFMQGSHPLFTNEKRTSDVAFNFRHQAIDEVEIHYPEGFTPQIQDYPKGVNLKSLGRLEIQLENDAAQRILRYRSFFELNQVIIPQSAYHNLKKAYEITHRKMTQPIVFKATPPPAP